MSKITLTSALIFLILGTLMSACASTSYPLPSPSPASKASSLLALQISLRKAQIASPNRERLSQMRDQGMNTTNLGIQRIYIYLTQQLVPAQLNDLRQLGITIYQDSWLPSAGNNPYSFYLAELPIDKLEALAAKDYVVRLDTAEKLFKPQSDLPQGG